MSQKDIRSFFGGLQSSSPGQPLKSPSTTTASSSRKSKRSARVIESDDDEDFKSTAVEEPPSKPESNNNNRSFTAARRPSDDKEKPSRTSKLTEISADIFFGSQTPSRSFKAKRENELKTDDKATSSKKSDRRNSEGSDEKESRLSGKLKKPCSERYGSAGKEIGNTLEKENAETSEGSDQLDDISAESGSKRKRTSDASSGENKGQFAIKQESSPAQCCATPRKKSKLDGKSTEASTNKIGADNNSLEVNADSTLNKDEKNSDAKNVASTPKLSSPKIEQSQLSAEEVQQRKVQNYRRFLERKSAPPANPGSLEVPVGSVGCLAGVTLVISGLLDNIGRDEATELCRRLGARVTSAVSRNTSYLVLGSDPGQSKTEKARKLGTPTLDEAGLFELIRSRTVKAPDHPAVEVKEESGDGCGIPEPVVPSSAASSQEKSQSQDVSPRSDPPSQAGPAFSGDQRLWVDKYRPATLKAVIGQQGEKSPANKLRQWLRNWHRFNTGVNRIKVKACAPGFGAEDGSNFKAAMLSGPPGVGKSTIAALVCAELGFDTVELNASDCRSRLLLEQYTDCLQSGSLANMLGGGRNSQPAFSSRHVLLMDEVDGMAGTEDRGGVAAVIQLLRTARVPIVCMCNDRQHQKIRSLAQYCFDLRVHRPRVEQIRAAMMSVCFREKLKVPREHLDRLIVGSNQDVRQVLHMLSLLSADRALAQTKDSSGSRTTASNVKDMRLNVFDVLMKVFSAVQRQGMSCDDKIRLFFNDYSLGPLFVQENYLSVTPSASRAGGRLSAREVLQRLSQTADSLCEGDVVDTAIRQRQCWTLLPVYAVFNTLVPGELLAGHLSGRVEFPTWLGRNSSRNRTARQLEELRRHVILRARAASTATLALDYCRPLRDHCLSPLLLLHRQTPPDQRGGAQADGSLARAAGAAASRLFDYDLLREDVDQLSEVCTWQEGSSSPPADPLFGLDAKWKAAFTRAVRNGHHVYPYSLSECGVAKKQDTASNDEEVAEASGEEREENEDVSADKMVKVKTTKKKVAGKKPAKETSVKEKTSRNKTKKK